jgi:hypothetical protein
MIIIVITIFIFFIILNNDWIAIFHLAIVTHIYTTYTYTYTTHGHTSHTHSRIHIAHAHTQHTHINQTRTHTTHTTHAHTPHMHIFHTRTHTHHTRTHACQSARNDFLSLAEFQKMVGAKFSFLNFPVAVERSYKRSAAKANQQLTRERFPLLLKNLLLYNRVLQMISQHDENNDQVLDLKEFTRVLKMLKPNYDEQTEREAPEAFRLCDSNCSGTVDFDEFCAWAGPFLLPDLLAAIQPMVCVVISCEQEHEKHMCGVSVKARVWSEYEST